MLRYLTLFISLCLGGNSYSQIEGLDTITIENGGPSDEIYCLKNGKYFFSLNETSRVNRQDNDKPFEGVIILKSIRDTVSNGCFRNVKFYDVKQGEPVSCIEYRYGVISANDPQGLNNCDLLAEIHDWGKFGVEYYPNKDTAYVFTMHRENGMVNTEENYFLESGFNNMQKSQIKGKNYERTWTCSLDDSTKYRECTDYEYRKDTCFMNTWAKAGLSDYEIAERRVIHCRDTSVLKHYGIDIEGDTLFSYQMVNENIDGYVLRCFLDDSGRKYFIRSIWQEGRMIDINEEGILFVGSGRKILSKKRFLAVNKEKNNLELFPLVIPIELAHQLKATVILFTANQGERYYNLSEERQVKYPLKLVKRNS